MKKGSTLFLKAIIVLIGLAVLALCIFVLPAGIMSDQTGAYRPILIGMYFPAIPFFIALYNGMKLLRNIETNNVFSHASVTALKHIQYCGFIISSFYALSMPYIFIVAERDDAPGVALIGFIFIFGALAVATAAVVFQQQLQKIIDIKSENDLTV